MEKNKEIDNEHLQNNNQAPDEKSDIILKILENEKDFISHINKLFECEFEELFPKILNLPKIDFLNQLTSNVSLILSEQFSSEILDNEKCISLITTASHSFDKTYNKYMEELTEGWDLYNYEKLNQIQNTSNEKLESFFFTKFRKHCHKTQDFALHECNNNGDIGHFIIVCGSSQSQSIHQSKDNSKNKIKYLICDNCRKSYFVHEFENYCEYCSTNYLCGPLIKDENKNFLVATLNPTHCETFVNEELLCEKCKNKLYIDILENKLKCGNSKCDYSVSIENNRKINFKCKICQNNFYSNVKIYNPIEVVHFKTVIDKALLYKRKAYPGKLSCCSKIKEKKTDFFHNKDCKGKIYFAECNQKILIVCSKCKAVNHYSRYIWTCPECGIHFRDKKSQENEMKIRKTKSSNKLIKYKKLFPNLEDENYLTISNNKRSLAELLNTRKNKNQINTLYKSYNNPENINTERNKHKFKFLSEKKQCETGIYNEKTLSKNEIQKKRKIKYILGKILPWGTPRKFSSDYDANSNKENTQSNNERKKEYYDKKVNDLINPPLTEMNIRKREKEHNNLCKSGRMNFKYESTIDIKNNENDDHNKREKGKNLYVRKYNGLESLKTDFEYTKNSKIISKYEKEYNSNHNNHNHNQTTIETNYAFNKMKSPGIKNVKKDNDLKCKKFVPIKLKYIYKSENEKNPINNNNNETNYKKIFNVFESQRIKKITPFDINIKKDNSNKIINIENNNNKESWQSKETTTKGSIESKNSVISRSPQKDDEEENKKTNKNKIFLNNDNYLNIQNIKIEEKTNIEREDDIIPAEMVDTEQDIVIENQNIKDDNKLYEHIQRRLKKILKKGKLPRFDLDKFSVEKQIGDGSFGVIYLVHNNKSKKKYAMKKIIANNINSIEVFQKEFEIAHHDRHPSITDIKGIHIKCFDSTTFVLYVLMDLAEKDWEVEINERQKNKHYYKEKELISILKQLSNALYFLQKEKDVAHRDVKPENVLIFKNRKEDKNIYGEFSYKLCDFGEAKDYALIHSKKQKTLRGTELYMSPILYNGLLKDASFVDHNAYKSDVFSLGCCMIIAANLDFDIINEIRILKEQKKIEKFLKNKLLGKYGEDFINIILKMINFNEKERVDFIQLEEMIKSIF